MSWWDVGERKYRIKEVEALQAKGAMITKEADSMSCHAFSDEERG